MKKYSILILSLVPVLCCGFSQPYSAKHKKSKRQVNSQNEAPIPTDNLPYPYNTLETVLPFNGHGWYGNGHYLEQIVNQIQPTNVVEVGSWLGTSTRHIASILKQPNAKLYAIDHWKGSIEHQVGQSAHVPFLSSLYEQFLSNVIRAGLTHVIIPIRMASLDAVQVLPCVPDLIYIDASHDYESVYNDLSAWYPLVKNHGVICGDDWSWGSVRSAVLDFAKDHSLEVFGANNFWRLIEK